MAVIIDATVGTPTANSYCSVSDAEDYFLTRGFNDNWTSATDAAKESALMWATRILDQQPWAGFKWTLTQSLRFPRSGLTDRDRRYVPYDIIPQFLKEATAELAMALLGEDRSLDEGGLVSVNGKVGPIKDPDYYQRKLLPDSVMEMILPYLTGVPNGMGKVGRV
jgi:hypothetical protein